MLLGVWETSVINKLQKDNPITHILYFWFHNSLPRSYFPLNLNSDALNIIN